MIINRPSNCRCGDKSRCGDKTYSCKIACTCEGFPHSGDCHYAVWRDVPPECVSQEIGDPMFTQLNTLRDHCHNTSLATGWYRNWDGVNISAQPPHSPAEREYVQGVACTKFALIHSEISEALEGYRKDKKDDHLPDLPAVDVELADALIRIFDLAGYLGCDLSKAVEMKMAYNKTRLDHTKEAREAPGGKRF